MQTALTHQLSQICPGAGGKGEASQPHNDGCVPPQQQLCRDVSQRRWKYRSLLALLSIPSLAQTGQTGEVLLSSRPIDQDTEGHAGRQQTKTKRLMAQEKEAKQGTEHRSLGAIRPTGGVSSLQESTPVKHLFLQCLCTPEFARASHHCQGPPLPKHPKCAIHTWSCPREDGLGSDAEQTGER